MHTITPFHKRITSIYLAVLKKGKSWLGEIHSVLKEWAQAWSLWSDEVRKVSQKYKSSISDRLQSPPNTSNRGCENPRDGLV